MTNELIQCQLDKTEITVGDPLELTCPLWKEHPAANQIKFVSGKGTEDFSIQFLGEPQIPSEFKLVQKLTSYKVGPHSFSDIKIKTETGELVVAPISFQVKSVLQQEQTQGQPQAQAPTPYPSIGPGFARSPWWWWAIWISILVFIATYSIYQIIKRARAKKLKSQNPQEEILTGEALFHSKMRKLESQEFHRRGQFKSFAFELTSILRWMITETLKVAAEDLTTEELIKKIETQNPSAFAKVGAELESLAQSLDLVKFSQTQSSTENCLVMLDRAYKIGRALYGVPK